MMNFLEKLYSYEYFPQILFATIAILLILLVVVILFGKKDEKVRKEEETRKLELSSLDTFAKEESKPTRLEITSPEDTMPKDDSSGSLDMGAEPIISNMIKHPISNEVHDEAQELVENALNNSIANDSVITEKNDLVSESTENTFVDNSESFMIPDFEIFKEEEKAEYQPLGTENGQEVPLSLDELHQKNEDNLVDKEANNVEPMIKNNLENTAVLPEFNFDELASSISKELDEINKLQEQANEQREKEEDVIPNKIDVTPIKEVTKFTPSSVFSSVYVNKEKEISPIINEEPIVKEESVKPILEEKPKEEISVIRNIIDEPAVETKEQPVVNQPQEPVKPVVSNPFIFDMPAKKEEKVETPKTEEKINNVNVPDFSSFENETYDIK
ncbi:MAG: hypothetical protein IJO33_02125 [Bacilli bacterium]|nr:hypothetical protein [Bacilli bacterium]